MASIFDGTSPMDPTEWLLEKTLTALCEAARLVDLANERDTTPWYSRRLREHADALIGRLAPVVALLYAAGPEAAGHDQWKPIVERGSFALAAWCKRWHIKDPRSLGIDFAANDVSPDERDAKAQEPEEVGVLPEEEASAFRRLTIYSALTRRMVHAELAGPSRRLLLWLLSHLELSESADYVDVSAKFLPTDIGCTVEETLGGYRELHEQRFIERLDTPGDSEGAHGLRLRLVVDGLNDSKHARPYRDVQFGFPGARIGGKPTWANTCEVPVPERLADAGSRWCQAPEDLAELRAALQAACGDNRAYVQSVRFVRAEDAPARLDVSFRSPLDEKDTELLGVMGAAAEQWLRERVVGART